MDTPQVASAVADAAAKYGVSPDLALSVAHAESGLDPSAVSPKGAVGVMQLTPDTASMLGVDPTDTAQNIDGGVRYLAHLNRQFDGDPELTAAAYNAGPGAVAKHGGVPPYPETQAYVQKVTDRLGDDPSPPDGDLAKAFAQGGYTDVPPSSTPAPLGADGTYADPRDPVVHRTPDGSIAYLGVPNTSPQQVAGVPLEIDISNTANPDAIAAYLKDHPEMAQAPTAAQAAVPSDANLAKEFAQGGYSLQPGGAAAPPTAPVPPAGPPAAPGDAATDVSALTKFSPDLAAGLSSGIDSLTGGFATKGRALWDALPALSQGDLSALGPQYSANLTGLQAQQAALKKEAPVASTIGGIGGILGQAALLPEAPALSLAARLGLGAAQGAGMGLFDALGHARGGMGEEAESAVLPTALGAVGGSVLGGVLGRGLPRVAPMATLGDYARAEVDPMLAVSGGRSAQELGQMLQGLPFIGTPLAKGAATTAHQLDASLQRRAALLGPAKTPFEAGGALQRGAQGAIQSMKDESDWLYQPVNFMETNTTPLAAPKTSAALEGFFQKYPTPAMKDWLTKNAPQIAGLRQTLQQAGGKLTFAEMKALRTDIGPLARNAEGVDGARLKKLYGALTDDMTAGTQQIGGDEGREAFQAATAHEKAMHDMIDQTFQKVLGKPDAPVRQEQAFNDLAAQARGGARADLARIARLKMALPKAAWNEVAGGIIYNLGRNTDGEFSAARFATDWAKMTPEAKRLIVSSDDDMKAMDSLFRVAKQQVAAGRFYNHSNSGHNAVGLMAAAETGSEFMALAATGHFKAAMVGLAINGALGAMGRGGATFLASPGVARLLLRAQSTAETNPAGLDKLFATFAVDNPALKTPALAFGAQVVRRLRSNAPAFAAANLANSRAVPAAPAIPGQYRPVGQNAPTAYLRR